MERLKQLVERVREQDFTADKPHGVFDAVINCRAFQGLSRPAISAAARHYFAALRPGGAGLIDTINVQGRRDDVLEDSLATRDNRGSHRTARRRQAPVDDSPSHPLTHVTRRGFHDRNRSL